jgi:hypothetical protein
MRPISAPVKKGRRDSVRASADRCCQKMTRVVVIAAAEQARMRENDRASPTDRTRRVARPGVRRNATVFATRKNAQMARGKAVERTPCWRRSATAKPKAVARSSR